MLFFVLLACVDSEPAFVSTREIDNALATGDTASLCAGLRMKDASTRESAASKLKDYPYDSSCLCERLQFDKRWDPSILSGLAKATDAEKVGCVGTLLDDPAQPERAALVTALLKIPVARARLVTAAASDADPTVRAAAMSVYRNAKDPAELSQVGGWLASDPNPAVRAAAAGALLGQSSAEGALRDAIAADTDPAVRAAALATYPSLKPADLDTVTCKALLEDASPEVRIAALGTMRATRDAEQLACLRQRASTEDTAPEVRAMLLKTLGSSAAPEAAAVLCDVIPSWVKTYVKDAAPAEGDDILRAQNDRDFERSYACVQAAVKAGGGYTCAGRAYVGAFFRDLGGKAGVPTCGASAGGRAASNEVVF
ncbi:MAG: HEAT repeat domain-containing protein [Pseudomonadota bacterium]|nr:HEAT repeat domain-containing protein [Pseudomonadota bacterium]